MNLLANVGNVSSSSPSSHGSISSFGQLPPFEDIQLQFFLASVFTLICIIVVMIAIVMSITNSSVCIERFCCLFGFVSLFFLRVYRSCCGPCDRGGRKVARLTQKAARFLRVDTDSLSDSDEEL